MWKGDRKGNQSDGHVRGTRSAITDIENENSVNPGVEVALDAGEGSKIDSHLELPE